MNYTSAKFFSVLRRGRVVPASPAPTLVLRTHLDATPPPRPTAPGFEILEEIGRGGMGVVYRARQTALNRIVALKMVLAGEYAHENDQLRFLAEAEAAAAVKHPNVVEVYEFGFHRGLAYFAMEFLPGGSLARKLMANGALAPDSAARLVESVARGVQAAHEAGVVHRDLKPGNILFVENRPNAAAKVVDFGLAKRGTGYDLTLTGMVVGTPAYMAPEQACGESVGPAADIYSLGAILYECLAGVAPFELVHSNMIMEQVAAYEPQPVRSHNPDVPLDLELICMKCLAKKPEERYASAAALGDDLRRHLAREPVSVRPAGRVEKAVKWARRNPARAVIYGLALAVFVLLGLSLGAVVLLQDARDARQAAEGEREKAAEALQQARIAGDLAHAAKLDAIAARERLAEVTAYEAIGRAGRELEHHDVEAVRDALAACRPDLRPWEWHYLHRAVHRASREVNEKHSVRSLAFAPDGRLLSAGTGGMRRWDMAKLNSEPFGPDQAFELSVSADGSRILAMHSGPYASIVESATGRVVATHRLCGENFDISPDGSRIGIADHKPVATIHDALSGERTASLAMGSMALAIAFDPSGRRIAVGGSDIVHNRTTGTIRFWDKTGQTVLSSIFDHGKAILGIAFSRDGNRIASLAEDRTIRISDVGTGNQICLLPSLGLVEARRLAFSPDGKLLLTGDADRAIRVWDAAKGYVRFTFRGHHGPMCAVAFTPDGSRAISSSLDGDVCEWDISGLPDAFRMLGRNASHTAISSTPDGERVLVTSEIRPPQLFDARTGKLLWTGATKAESLRFAPDGRSIRGFTENGEFGEWDPSTGKESAPLKKLGFEKVFALSADGSRVLCRGNGGSIIVMDVRTGERKCEITGGVRRDAYWAAISPDGKRVVTSGNTADLHVWDADTGNLTGQLRGHNHAARSVAFSPDGKRIVTGGFEGPAKVWDAATFRNVLTIYLKGTITAVGFSPEGARLLLCDWSGTVHSFAANP